MLGRRDAVLLVDRDVTWSNYPPEFVEIELGTSPLKLSYSTLRREEYTRVEKFDGPAIEPIELLNIRIRQDIL